MKQKYMQPEIMILEFKIQNQLLQSSVIVTDEETEEQW